MSETNKDHAGVCYRCAAKLAAADYGRQNVCDQCGFNTHVCKNCIFHDPSYNNQCREPQADRVVDKEASNFCDYFKPVSTAVISEAASEAKKAAEALFGSGLSKDTIAAPSTVDEAKKAAADLFKKK